MKVFNDVETALRDRRPQDLQSQELVIRGVGRVIHDDVEGGRRPRQSREILH